ncbi:MAG: hypothetical protein HUU35_08700 [Armatimonadetes bacterium]|nr:hypothetical protein [Armatimonadota bacterium]
MRPNRVRRRLAAGQLVAGPFVFLKDPHVVGAAAASGFDFVCCCLEHGQISFETLQTMVYAADAAGITPFARVSDVQRQSILRVIETGVHGILLPWCEDANIARELVRHARYHPAGARGSYAVSYATDYGRTPLVEHFGSANEELLLMVQIESAEAVEAIDSIAGVDGIDVVMVGPGDLSLQLGHPQEYDHPAVLGAVDKVVERVLAAGKQVGLLHTTPEFTARYLARGVKLWWWGQDLNLMRRQMLEETRLLREQYGWHPNPGRDHLSGS